MSTSPSVWLSLWNKRKTFYISSLNTFIENKEDYSKQCLCFSFSLKVYLQPRKWKYYEFLPKFDNKINIIRWVFTILAWTLCWSVSQSTSRPARTHTRTFVSGRAPDNLLYLESSLTTQTTFCHHYWLSVIKTCQKLKNSRMSL